MCSANKHKKSPQAQPLGQTISLKLLLEIRLELDSFKPLIDFLLFLDKKL